MYAIFHTLSKRAKTYWRYNEFQWKKERPNTKRSNIKFPFVRSAHRVHFACELSSLSQFFNIKYWNRTLAHQEGSMQQRREKNWSNINVFKRIMFTYMHIGDGSYYADMTRLKHNTWWDMMTTRVGTVHTGTVKNIHRECCILWDDIWSCIARRVIGCVICSVVISCFSLISTNSKFVCVFLFFRYVNKMCIHIVI